MNAHNPTLSDSNDQSAYDEILRVVSEFAAKEIAPRAAEIDEKDEWPTDIWNRFVELGLLGLRVPEEFGGSRVPVQVTARIFEEVSKASAMAGLTLASTVEWLLPIVAYAHEDLRNEALQRVMVNGEVACLCITEPSGGSDATAMKTRAVQNESGDWVINGQKAWCSFGAIGSIFLVFAVTDPDARKSRRLSAFLIDAKSRGLNVGRNEKKIGLKGIPLNPVEFDDVIVSQARMVGERGQGLAVAMHLLNESRVGVAAQCVGLAQYALERAAAYAQERTAFGVPIIEHQAVQLMLADMVIRTESARALTQRAALAYDTDAPECLMLAAAAKASSTDNAVTTALDAIQIHGANGLMHDYGVERVLRDAKGFQIFEGTNQIMRLTIAKTLAGKLGKGA